MRIEILSWALFAWVVAFVGAQEYRVLDYGAVGDGVTNDTVAIKAAMQAAAQSNGGRVIFDANYTFLTAPLDITSNLIMDIRGEIKGSPYGPDYYALPQDPWWGAQYWGPVQAHALLLAYNVSNITITGGGKVNGVAENWSNSVGPFTLKLVYTNDSTVENITLYNCPRWTFNLALCDNIHINHVNISNQLSPNMETWGDGISNDGFDMTICNNILLENSFYTGGDNSILVQSGIGDGGIEYGRPIENITIRNMKVWYGGSIGFSIGAYYARNITFDNITTIDMETAIGASTYSGAWVDDITFSNWHMINSNTTASITGWNSFVNGNIILENITNDASGVIANWRNPTAWDLQGFNFTIRNVKVRNTKPGALNYGGCVNVTGTCENAYPFCPCLGSAQWEYYDETDSFYSFVLEQMVYDDAENYCIQNGGHLVSIHSDFENSFILSHVNKTINKYSSTYFSPTFWIGFYSADDQTYQWIDQSSVNFLKWAVNAPNPTPAVLYPCVYMNINPLDTTGHYTNWDDYANCTTTALPFVCKASRRQQQQSCNSATTTTSGPGSSSLQSILAAPWGQYNNQTGAYYMVVSETANFSYAEDYCVQAGGHLTSIVSATEDSIVINLAVQAYNAALKASDYNYNGTPEKYWIGYYSTNNQTFEWIDGSTANYTNWYQSHDSFHPCMYIATNVQQWNDDYDCNSSFPFICKLVLEPDQPI